MTEPHEAPPPYDASRVMLNGAAIGLVTSLTSGMEARLILEIKAAEERQNAKLDAFARAVTGDVDDLQTWRDDMNDARLVRQGQMSVLSGFASFLIRYDKVILGIGIGLASGVVAAVAGVHL